jgi:hypothetical protein
MCAAGVVQLLLFSASVSLLVTHGVLPSAAATLALMLNPPSDARSVSNSRA